MTEGDSINSLGLLAAKWSSLQDVQFSKTCYEVSRGINVCQNVWSEYWSSVDESRVSAYTHYGPYTTRVRFVFQNQFRFTS